MFYTSVFAPYGVSIRRSTSEGRPIANFEPCVLEKHWGPVVRDDEGDMLSFRSWDEAKVEAQRQHDDYYSIFHVGSRIELDSMRVGIVVEVLAAPWGYIAGSNACIVEVRMNGFRYGKNRRVMASEVYRDGDGWRVYGSDDDDDEEYGSRAHINRLLASDGDDF